MSNLCFNLLIILDFLWFFLKITYNDMVKHIVPFLFDFSLDFLYKIKNKKLFFKEIQ
jgi:hypothetical protein